MGTRKSTTFFHVPLEKATTPVDGECIAGRYWQVHPVHGLRFFADLHPYTACLTGQYHEVRSIAAHLCPEDHDLVKVPVVYLQHAKRRFAELQKARKKAQRTA